MTRNFIFLFLILVCLSSIPARPQSTQSQEKNDGLSRCTRHDHAVYGSTNRHQLPSIIPAPGTAVQEHACPTASEWWPEFVARLQEEPSATTSQTWTVLFYDDADFSNAYDPFPDFSSDAHSDVNVNVLVLQDTRTLSSLLWYVNPNHSYTCVGRWGEVDMGSYVTLRDFIAYGKTHYPADRYLLALYDHGGGWAGACTDVTNGGWLLMDDIKMALNETGGVDVICFTAPCLMGAVESVYELRDEVDVYIGSEELSGYAHWLGIFDNICGVLNNSAALTNDAVGMQILQFVADNQYWIDEYKTMSAVKASAVADVVQHLDALAQYTVSHMWTLFDAVTQARGQTWEMGADFMEVEEVDLYDFAVRYGGLTSDPVVLQHVQNITDALDQAILAECHGSAQLGAHGLSVYFPDALDDYNPNYTDVDLDYAADTQWDELLNLFLNFDVPVRLQSYASSWVEDHVEIKWILKIIPGSQPTSFTVARASGGDVAFLPLDRLDVVRGHDEFTCRDFTARPGEEYTYRVKVFEGGSLVTAFETTVATPAAAMALFQNDPNPFSSDTRIEFVVPGTVDVKLEVFDASGKRVRILSDGVRQPGKHQVFWDGRDANGERVASGLYFYRVKAGKTAMSRKCLLLR